MPKIKPFVWIQPNFLVWKFETSFGSYAIQGVANGNKMAYLVISPFESYNDNECFPTIEQAKRFAFDDFKRRLEETLNEPVGYDLEIDENC